MRYLHTLDARKANELILEHNGAVNANESPFIPKKKTVPVSKIRYAAPPKRKFKTGDKVLWNDPALEREILSAKERHDMLSRIWTIDRISGDIIEISTEGSEAEVYPHELTLVSKCTC